MMVRKKPTKKEAAQANPEFCNHDGGSPGRVFLCVIKDGEYVQRELKPEMVCSLFDLNYMIGDYEGLLDDIEHNGMTRALNELFTIVEFIDDAMHGNKIGYLNEDGKLSWREKKTGEYIFGKPDWKPYKRSGTDDGVKRE